MGLLRWQNRDRSARRNGFRHSRRPHLVLRQQGDLHRQSVAPACGRGDDDARSRLRLAADRKQRHDADSDLELTRAPQWRRQPLGPDRRARRVLRIEELSANLTAGIEDLSDFGDELERGLTWAPFDNLTLSATRIYREVAPSLTDLGSPRIDEFNVPVFDYARGETEFNSDYGQQSRSARGNAGELEIAPVRLRWENTRVNVDWNQPLDDVTATPGFGAAFERAFPDRVQRDAAGTLLAIDRRRLPCSRRAAGSSPSGSTPGEIGKAPEPREERGGRGGCCAASGQSGGVVMMDTARMGDPRGVLHCARAKWTCRKSPSSSGRACLMRTAIRSREDRPGPRFSAGSRPVRIASDCRHAGRDLRRSAQSRRPARSDARAPQERSGRDRSRSWRLCGRACVGGRCARCGPECRTRRVSPRVEPAAGCSAASRVPARAISSASTTISRSKTKSCCRRTVRSSTSLTVMSCRAARSRHTARLEGGIFKQGYGMRLSGNCIGEAGSWFGPAGIERFVLRRSGDLRHPPLRRSRPGAEEGRWLARRSARVLERRQCPTRRRVEDEDGVVPIPSSRSASIRPAAISGWISQGVLSKFEASPPRRRSPGPLGIRRASRSRPPLRQWRKDPERGALPSFSRTARSWRCRRP